MTARLRELKSSVNANLELRMIDMFEALPGTIGEIERVDKAVRVLGNDVAALRGSLDAIHMGKYFKNLKLAYNFYSRLLVQIELLYNNKFKFMELILYFLSFPFID